MTTGDFDLQLNAPNISMGGTLSTTSIIGKAVYIAGGLTGTFISSTREAEVSGQTVQLKTTNGNTFTMGLSKMTMDANNTEIDLKALKIEHIALNHQRSNDVRGTAIISDVGNEITLKAETGTGGPGILRLFSTDSIYLGSNVSPFTDSVNINAKVITSTGTDINLNASATVDIQGVDVDVTGSTSVTIAAPDVNLNGAATVDIQAADVDITGSTSVTTAAPAINLNAGATIDLNAPDIDLNASTSVTTTAPDINLNATTVDVTASDVDINGGTRVDINTPIFTTKDGLFERFQITGNRATFTGGSFELFLGV
jgi:hypothetical protein